MQIYFLPQRELEVNHVHDWVLVGIVTTGNSDCEP